MEKSNLLRFTYMGTWSPKTVVVYMADKGSLCLFFVATDQNMEACDYFNPCNVVLATSKLYSFYYAECVLK